MIFVGDIALPYKGAIDLAGFPHSLLSKNWYGNLEGAIVQDANNKIPAVFNNVDAISELISDFNFTGFALANNHIFDTGKIEDTLDFLKNNNIKYCGIGSNITEANKEIVFFEVDSQIVIVNFGWEVIQCEISTDKSWGVNPLRKSHVLQTIKDLREKYPGGKIIPYMHWGYELESEPQPFERELAKAMIDLGATGVIGSHSHRVGGFEIYQGKPIVYSLGNWLFKQNYYLNGKLSFPDFCNLEMAFEWHLSKEEFIFHFFTYNKEISKLTFLSSEDLNSPIMAKHTPFINFNIKEYEKWYKVNHYHKNKGLPIYYWSDTQLEIKFKNIWNKVRDSLLKVILNKGK